MRRIIAGAFFLQIYYSAGVIAEIDKIDVVYTIFRNVEGYDGTQTIE